MDRMHRLANSGVDQGDWDGETRVAIVNEATKYSLSLGSYSSDTNTPFALFILHNTVSESGSI